MTNPAPDPAPAGGGATPNEPGTPVAPVDKWHFGRMFFAWGFAAVCGLLVSVFAPSELRFEWLALAVGASVLVTFALQLGTAQREGFITRTAFSVAGATVIIALIDIVGLIIAQSR